MPIPLLFGDNRKHGGMAGGAPAVPELEMAGEEKNDSLTDAFITLRAALNAGDNPAGAAALKRFVKLAMIPGESYGGDQTDSARGY